MIGETRTRGSGGVVSMRSQEEDALAVSSAVQRLKRTLDLNNYQESRISQWVAFKVLCETH